MSGYVLLVSYPKSGNTWLRIMLETVRRNGQPPGINEIGIPNAAARLAHDRVLDLETSDLSPAEIARARPWVFVNRKDLEGSPRILKVHDAKPPAMASPVFPREAVDRVVYIARDPRDVVVSAAAFFGSPLAAQVKHLGDPMYRLGRSANGLNTGVEQLISSWSNHVASWLDAGECPLLLVRYEDLVADTRNELERAARFVGFSDAADVISKAVEAANFATLAAEEQAVGFREASRKATSPFFRRGVVGAWQDSLPADLAAEIVREHGVMMKRLGYKI